MAVWETGPRGDTVLGDPATAMSLKTLDELSIESIGLDSAIATATDGNGNTRTRSGTITLNDGTTRQIAEYRFARDNAETKFLDWRKVPAEIAVLPGLTSPSTARLDARSAVRSEAEDGGIASRRDRHTLGGVQMAGNGAGWPAAEESQFPQDGEKQAANKCEWRRAA